MALITYPLDETDYTADGAALFHCTRNTGIYAGEDFSASVSGADNTVTIKPGIAWMRVNRFRGLVSALKQDTDIDMGLPDSVYPRLDRIILQYDANKNDIQLTVKSGSPSGNPLPPERAMSDVLYEIHLYEVRREPGAVSITAANIKDLRLDADCCGLMADSVTSVDTAAINTQVDALIEQLQAAIDQTLAGAVPDSSVSTAKLQNEAVTEEKIAPKAVTPAKLDRTYAELDAAGKVTPAQVSSAAISYQGNRTLVLSDAGRLILMVGADAQTVTIPTDTAVAFPVGTEIEVVRWGAGSVTFAPATGVVIASLDNALSIAGQFGVAALKKLDASTWFIAGALA